MSKRKKVPSRNQFFLISRTISLCIVFTVGVSRYLIAADSLWRSHHRHHCHCHHRSNLADLQSLHRKHITRSDWIAFIDVYFFGLDLLFISLFSSTSSVVWLFFCCGSVVVDCVWVLFNLFNSRLNDFNNANATYILFISLHWCHWKENAFIYDIKVITKSL